MEKTNNFIRTYLMDKTVVLGCSYGPDSMCLLDLLIKNKISVICTHVNHNIREESNEEEQSLKAWCKLKGITFERKLLAKGDLSEAHYRKERLNFYKEIADKYKTNIILTAHHGDDLIETILMRLTRGSTLSGYGGFKIKNHIDGYVFMKPLIFYTKADLLKYNKKNNIPYAVDKTNLTDKYQRNRFRKQVLPFLKRENKNVNEKFLEYSKEIYEAEGYLSKVILDAYNKTYKDNSLQLVEFKKLDDYIQKGVLKIVFKSIYGDDINKISRKHIEKIVELIKKNSSFSYYLPKGFTVLREYDKLLFSKSLAFYENKPYSVNFNDKFNFKNHTISKIEYTSDQSNFILRLDSSKIKLPLIVRSKKNSDKIMTKNSDYYKKIKKVFIDKKIPKRLRGDYPIVVDSKNNVLWIPGIVKSKFDMDYNEKYDIILKYERKDEFNEEKK